MTAGGISEAVQPAARVMRKLMVGPAVWLERINFRFIEPAFVAYWGAGTVGDVYAAELGVDGVESLHYSPSPWLVTPLVLWACPLGADDVLVDLGCGKGRVMLQVARHRVSRVVGVDGSERMAALARANLSRNSHRLRCGSYEVVVADLREYEFPDDTTILFLYNSVQGSVFAALFEHVLELAERRGTSVRLVYYYPVEHQRIMASGRARLRRCIAANAITMQRIHVYEVLAR